MTSRSIRVRVRPPGATSPTSLDVRLSLCGPDHLREPGPGCYKGDVSHLQLVGARGGELPISPSRPVDQPRHRSPWSDRFSLAPRPASLVRIRRFTVQRAMVTGSRLNCRHTFLHRRQGNSRPRPAGFHPRIPCPDEPALVTARHRPHAPCARSASTG